MAPQIIYIVMLAMGLTAGLFIHGQQHTFNWFWQVFGAAITFAVLWWGGFFVPLFGG